MEETKPEIEESASGNTTRLPTFYRSIEALTEKKHSDLYLASEHDYEFAAGTHAIPITVDEFPKVMQDYPILLAAGKTPIPVALVGRTFGKNEFVDEKGEWRPGAYIPAYVRRYPFAYSPAEDDPGRLVLCADFDAKLFAKKGKKARKLFHDGEPSEMMKSVIDFCNAFERGIAKTREVMKQVAKLGLLDPTTVTVTQDDKSYSIEGFQVISEEKPNNLSDKALADLARSGVLKIFAAHHLSMTKFSNFGE